MFPSRYFNPRFWASRFWPKVGAAGTAATIHVLPVARCVIPSVATFNLRIPAVPLAACRIPSIPTLTMRAQ